MRARNLKPSFFKNEELADVPFEARILFIGLWCMADREGRLEDRPKRIKAEVFPYDSVQIEKLIDVITCHGFIVRYGDNQKRYIQIINFNKHQRPHPHEAKSIIPPCNDITCNVRLNPDVMNAVTMNPDVRNPESLSPSKPPAAGVPYEDFLKSYNDFRGKLPEAKSLNDDRKRKMRIRWAKNPDLVYWKNVTEKLAMSELAQKWASLDWILANDTNHVKAMEGNYDNRRNGDLNARTNSPVRNISRDPATAGYAE